VVSLQPQAIGYNKDRGQCHGRRGDNRVEEAERGERQRRDVVAKRPHEIAADRPERGPRQPDRFRDRPQVVAEQDQVGGADRDIGPGSEGEPQVSGG
jgi:hypothetical protein